MSEIDDIGAHFYLGPAPAIAAAATAWRWQELRSGNAGVSFLAFPACVHSLDVLLLSRAIADTTGVAEEAINDRSGVIAGEAGLWSAQVMSEAWVRSVASISAESIEPVCGRWSRLTREEYDVAWGGPAVVDSLRQLTQLAHRALTEQQDLVMIWAL